MASIFSLQKLSGSTNGRVVPVAATATAGTTIHTALSGTSGFDEIYLWASNVTGSTATLTIEFGGVTDPGDHLVKALTIPANSGPTQVCFGQVLQNGLLLRAFSGTASAINLSGYVLRAE
jgi:hypothetical protein